MKRKSEQRERKEYKQIYLYMMQIKHMSAFAYVDHTSEVKLTNYYQKLLQRRIRNGRIGSDYVLQHINESMTNRMMTVALK